MRPPAFAFAAAAIFTAAAPAAAEPYTIDKVPRRGDLHRRAFGLFDDAWLLSQL